MVRPIDDAYSDEVTKVTGAEFRNFVKWYNEKIGHEPLIVGGWAVHAYVPSGRGSRDIDVLYPGAAVRDETLRNYWQASGYREEKTSWFTVSYVKDLQTKGGGMVTIYIDPSRIDEDTVDKNTGIRLTWKLADKHRVRKEIGHGIFVYVPEPELLLAYKIGAIVKRERERTGSQDKAMADYLFSKIVKDAYDIVQLLSNYNLNYKRIYAFCKNLNISLRYLKECDRLIRHHGRDAGIEELLPKSAEGFSRMYHIAAGMK